MTDDIDNIPITTKPLKSRSCPVCGMYMNGFVSCPWCGGVRKTVKKQRRWIGGVEIK